MNWLTQYLPIALQLLPGFMATAIFYALTAHPKASEFERGIEALIFTVLLRILTTPIRWALLAMGKHWFSLSQWSADAELAWMTVLSLPLGLLFAWVANRDIFHRLARRVGITKRTSYPTEWYAAFDREPRWVILHLEEGKRLYGWPEEWPDQPEKGHFVIDQPEWVMDDSSKIPILQTSKFIVRASDVKRVEFLQNVGDCRASEEELATIQRPLIELHGSNDDGNKRTTTGSEPAR